MAQRRMFSKKVTNTDLFLDMPLSAQCLYFHLNMDADDDGFLGNPKTIRRQIGASEDDLKLLLAKHFLIPFENGVVVIKDWRIHNYIQKDRYNETIFSDEKDLLTLDKNNRYQLMDTKCIQGVSNVDTQVRLGKSKSKVIDNNIPSKQVLTDRFNAIWANYPNKKGKDKAFKAYTKAVKEGVTDTEISQGIDNYKKEIAAKNTDKQYIAHGSTWFINHRWEDVHDFTPAINKNVIRQEKVPDWANKPPEEKELPKKEKEMIDREIQDFLQKGDNK